MRQWRINSKWNAAKIWAIKEDYEDEAEKKENTKTYTHTHTHSTKRKIKIIRKMKIATSVSDLLVMFEWTTKENQRVSLTTR